MKKMFKILFALLITISFATLHGCYPYEDVTIADSDVVVTNYNDSIDFTSFSTYYMPDTIFILGEDTGDEIDVEPYQTNIFNTIKSNMTAYGYSLVTPGPGIENPDIALVVGVTSSTWVSGGWYYPYYPYYGWGYWGGYYPYYPPVPYYTSYSTGSIVLSLFDPEDYTISSGDTIVKGYWSAIMNGIIESSTSDMNQRITSMINQAYTQTPQIKTN